MCERIASREFDWTRDTVQPLLKLFRGVGLGRAPYHAADRIKPPPLLNEDWLIWFIWFVLFIWLV